MEPCPDLAVAANYVRGNFMGSDRLAVVLLNRRTNSVIQRLASAENIVEPPFLNWITEYNDRRFEVYISMNALRAGARGRTKNDVALVRHVFLDFDEDATAALQRMLRRPDLPRPTNLISSSPGKWQVTWKVEGFTKEHSEALQRRLARDLGADPAAVDCSRVLRLPGFLNYKYSTPHYVSVESLSIELYNAQRFPQPSQDRGTEERENLAKPLPKLRRPTTISQSERDWAYAKRALARGESLAAVIASIAEYRRHTKAAPFDYAVRTAHKAQIVLEAERAGGSQTSPERA